MSTNSLMLRVRQALESISPPISPSEASTGAGKRSAPPNIIAGGFVKDLSVSPAGVAKVTLDPARIAPDALPPLAGAIEKALADIEGVARTVVTGPRRSPGPQAGAESDAAIENAHANPLGLRGKREQIAAGAEGFANVKRVIAVASGKGGVGKSTVAANLAAALAAGGARVGLLDADVYGPSLPTLLGVGAAKPALKEGRIQPIEAAGLKTMSIGYMVDEEKALAWRGPMVMGAVRQIINDVDWGALDFLVIDTPPGTGDAHLTLGQMRRGGKPGSSGQNQDAPAIDGVVVVSTPQELALADVRRGIEFFRKVGTPILGVIENMAYLEGPDGARQHLFGEGGAKRAAEALGARVLGEIPLIPDLRVASDEGRLLGNPATKAIFTALAGRVAASLNGD
ncbi:MAG: Mrp/NBP35 family ATP-binding protein [Pseudomonadota bacterium]